MLMRSIHHHASAAPKAVATSDRLSVHGFREREGEGGGSAQRQRETEREREREREKERERERERERKKRERERERELTPHAAKNAVAFSQARARTHTHTHTHTNKHTHTKHALAHHPRTRGHGEKQIFQARRRTRTGIAVHRPLHIWGRACPSPAATPRPILSRDPRPAMLCLAQTPSPQP